MAFTRFSLRTAALAGALVTGALASPAGFERLTPEPAVPGQDLALAQGRGGGRGARGGQVRDAQPQPIGTASIQGAVYSETGSAVRRARVTLTGGGLRGGRSTVTDDQGAFEFLALPAGRYNMTASKPGYVNNAYGARSPGRPGTPIQLSDGQGIEKAYMTLPRGGVLTGIVIDDYGEPAPGTQVRALRFVMQSGERSVQQAGVDQTDDRGMYRIYGLQPGEYMVSAVPRNQNLGDLRQAVMSEVEALLSQAGVAAAGGRAGGARVLGGMAGAAAQNQELIARAAELQQQLQAQVDEQAVAYAPVYYPGTASPSNAQSVMLGVSEERVGVDFQLQLVQTARVEGFVMSPDGTLPQGTQVVLVPADLGGLTRLPGLGNDTTRVNQEGRFTFSNITPGQYTLQARAAVREVDPAAEQAAQGRGGRGGFGGRGGAIAQVLWASMDLSVAGTDLTDLVLNLAPGMTVSGQIQFEGLTAQAPTDLTTVRVNLVPRGPQSLNVGGVPPATVDEGGRFTITGVAPGRYAVSAGIGGGRGGGRGGIAPSAPTGQWVLKSARVGAIDALDFPFEVAPNENINGVSLTFTDQTQELTGMVQDASGMPIADFTIILFPSDERYWVPQSRRIASARPDTEGRFGFRGLPAGDYRLTAITDAEPGEWYNPAFLGQLVGSSISLTISPGEKKVQDLKVAGGGGF